MKAALGFVTNKWFIQFVGVVALGVLIWFAGPLIAIAGEEPLVSEMARILTVVAIGVAWLIFRLLMQVRAARKDQRLMVDLAAAVPTQSPEEAAGEEEVAYLRKNFEEALALLRETRGKGKRGMQFLYELPWYVIIGAPGSGKTTALVNSGLQFPLAERFGKSAIKGVSGTRNCDWWFTDEAVLLDTAGRYTTQDSHHAVDAAAWQGFLGLVKKHRARRPLNGVLVAMSVADLLQQTDEERRLNARAVRRRIAEIYQTLGVRFPVYLLFTKCDLVAGFTDFFGDLTQEERAQVWGETFAAEDPNMRVDVVDVFESAYQDLLKRLDQRTYPRICAERDVQRRAAIFEFPQQMALLKPAIDAFLQDAFGATRYEQPILLRGVYLTSATQQGTPIDRVMGILAQAFHLGRQATPVYSGRGRSYFLTRLLREVIFPEAELAGVDPKLERRYRLTRIALYAGVGVLSIGMAALWTLSYQQNKRALTEVQEQVDQYRAVTVAGSDWLSNIRALLPRLRALRRAGRAYQETGLTTHMGLYQGNKVQSALDRVYENLLQSNLLPLVKSRLEQRMTGDEGTDPDVLYELLRIYLSLGEPERVDTETRAAAETLIGVDLQRNFVSDPESVAEINVALDSLLRLPPEPIALNSDVISGARARLKRVPQLVQIYTHLKNEELRDHSADLRLGDVLGPSGSRVFVATGGRDVADLTIPGFFTAKGYAGQFLKDTLKALQTSLQQNRVLGQDVDLEPAELERMRRDFERLYLADYRDAWAGLLATIQLRRGQTIQQTAMLLDELSQKDSPLRKLLTAVEANTSLSRVSASVAQDLTKQLGINLDAGKLDPHLKKALDAARAAAGVGDAAQQPVRDLEREFEGLNRLVRKDGEPEAPVEDLLQTLKELHTFALQAASGGQALQSIKPGVAGAGGGSPAQVAGKLKNLPEPLKSALSSVALSVGSQVGTDAKVQLNAMLSAGISAPCQEAFAGRYPFARTSLREATITDFGKFFSPNGILDGFFQNNLRDLVDTARLEWRQLPGDSPSFHLSDTTIAQFQNAAKIRDAFFPSGGQLPKVQFDLRPVALDQTVAAFTLNIEGQQLRNQHGPEQLASVQWPGPEPNKGVQMVFRLLGGQEVRNSKQGAWALFRLLDEMPIAVLAGQDRFQVTFQAGGHQAVYELRAGSVQNPFHLPALRAFRCPEGL